MLLVLACLGLMMTGADATAQEPWATDEGDDGDDGL
jgi:hypothetical protein